MPNTPPKSQKVLQKWPPGGPFCQTQTHPENCAVLGYPGTSKMRLPPRREHTFHCWHRIPKRYQKYLQNAPFWASFCPLGHPNAAFGPFLGRPKILCFLRGVQMPPSARKHVILDEMRHLDFGTFFELFSKGYPPQAKSHKNDENVSFFNGKIRINT